MMADAMNKPAPPGGEVRSAGRRCGSSCAGVTPAQVGLAWLLQHAPNILLISGTSSMGHLRENVAAAEIDIPAELIAHLEAR